MLVSVSDAKGQLTELVRRAEAGDEVVLTRHGKAVARIVPVKQTADAARKAVDPGKDISCRCRQGHAGRQCRPKPGFPL